MTFDNIDALEALYVAGRIRDLIDACTKAGTHHFAIADTWASAMTAEFGPIGLHDSWRDEHGRPTAECLAQFPRIADTMRAARERIPGLLASARRYLESDLEMSRLLREVGR